MFSRHKKLRNPHITSSELPGDLDVAPATCGEHLPSIHTRTRLQRLLGDDKNLKYFFLLLGLIITTGAGLIIMLSLHREPTISDKIIVPKPKPAPKFYSPLTGAETTEDATKRPVTAVMIENSPEARPQSGLKQGGVIYEAIAEGGITRFVVLYQESRPSLLGPVRSVRPYYVEWASAYDPAVAHVGGSQRALSMIRSGNYGLDMDQFFNGSSYWRTSDRAAPHNVYTSFDKLDAMRSAKGKTASTFQGFARKDAMTPAKITAAREAGAVQANSINLDISTGQFHVEYAYQADSNTYKRSQGKVEHYDQEDGLIAPAVVVAIKVPMSIGMEDGYREQITTTGSGKAYVFQDGTVVEGTWSRDSEKARLVLTGADGKEIVLNRGQTWITAVPDNKGVSW
ncbi:MAG: DUF3048 domain-containing protein [Candidatus Saccharimonadales bacterium]